MSTLKAHSNGSLYSNTVIRTLAVDGWAVTFGTASSDAMRDVTIDAKPKVRAKIATNDFTKLITVRLLVLYFRE